MTNAELEKELKAQAKELAAANEKLGTADELCATQAKELAAANEKLGTLTEELNAIKASGGEVNKDTAAIRTENGNLKAKLVELEGLLKARAAKKGALICVTNIKEDGKKYAPGALYDGSKGVELLKNGSLRLQD